MVDFQRKNHNRITKLEQIIANLKQYSQQHKNRNYVPKELNETESSVTENNSSSVSTCFSKACKKKESQSNITDYYTVVKTAPCSSPTTDVNIWSVLENLKANKENGPVTTFENERYKNNTCTNCDQTRNVSSNGNTGIKLFKNSGHHILCNRVKESDRQLNASTEIVRKTQNYHKRRNNKRLKICDNRGQSVIADFFNMEHKAISNTTENRTVSTVDVDQNSVKNTAFDNITSCFDKQVKEASKQSESSGENLSDEKCEPLSNLQFHIKRAPGEMYVTNSLHRSHSKLNSKENNEKTLNVLKNFKIKEPESCTKQIDGNKNIVLNNKKSLPVVNHVQSETTFDDFCNNVVRIIGQNINESKKTESEKYKKKLQFSNSTINCLPKSYSTGVLIERSQRNSYRDLTSLPITDIEIKIRKEKLVQNNISFDDFVKNVLKDLSDSKSSKKNCEGNTENICDSEEEINNFEYKKNTTAGLMESLKNDSQVDLVTMDNTLSILTLPKCGDEKLYQHSPEHILQKANNIFPENALEIENNLETFPSMNYSKSCADNMNSNGHNLKLDAILSQCGEEKGSESEDFLSYFPKNWNGSSQLLKEPTAELLTAKTDRLPDSDCNRHKDYVLPLLEGFPINIYNEFSPEICQAGTGIVQKIKIEKEDNCDSDIHDTNEYPNFTESNAYTNKEGVSEEQTFNNLVNGIVSENSQVNRDTEQITNKTEKLNDFLEKLLKQNTLRHEKNCGQNKVAPRKTYIKRYRKGKTKIYRISKLKKTNSKTEIVEEEEQNLNFDDIFKKITEDLCIKNKSLTRSKSMSSISTSSSYVTDVTRSEILSTGSNELSSPKQRLRKGFNELCEDKSLLYCEEQWESTTEYEKEEIKMKIQETIMKVVEDFSEKNSSSLKYRKQSFDNCIFKDGRLQLKPMEESSMTVVNSKIQRSQPKFTLIFYLLKKIQNLLETDTKLTKRELYYQLKTLIRDQQVTDRAINAISCMLNVGMWALNIVAQKGLVFGNLKILLSSGETLNCNIPGTLIPQDINAIVEIASPAYFILVVEKESIFYKLIEEDLPNRLTRPFIMITGKGFPDLNTQLFLKKLWMIMSIPVFILVDADPHGINIMLNYRFGSVKNAHVSHQLAVPNAKWLGVYPSEVVNLNITRELLSERELKLVNQLLRTPYMECNPKIVHELKVLLETKCKAEIEGLIKSDTYLSEVYLPNKFFTHNFI